MTAGLPTQSALDAVTCLLLLTLILIGKIRERTTLDFNTALSINLASLTAASWLGAGGAGWFYALVPVAVLCQTGTLSAILWSALALLLILVINLIPWCTQAMSQAHPLHLEIALSQISILIVVLAFSMLQWRVSQWQIERTEEQARGAVAQAVALGRARDQALAAAEARSRFLATMSHEIRTPLNGILGTASALEHAGLSSDQRELIGIIRNSGDLLLGLVNDILDFSKLESGKLKFESVSFCLEDTIRAVLKGLEREAEERGLKLKFKIEGKFTRRTGDPLRIRQILVNLISNAIKFTHQGTVMVQLRAQADELAVEVHDTGIGMNVDQLKNLFQPFQQGDTSTTRRYGGTGLGLAICKKLTADMNGSLTVTSQPNLGSVFTFRVRLPVAPNPSSTAPSLTLVEKTRDLSALHILVVDDNPINLRVALTLLKKLRCRTDAATNGLEALQMAEQLDFDVILMDAHMPEMDGAESTRRIRLLQSAKRPLIIAVTADVMPEQARSLNEAGVDGVLYKPFTLEILERTLAKWLPLDSLTDQA
jgi:signal transduction histidine kinase